MRWVFEELSRNKLNTEQVWKKAKEANDKMLEEIKKYVWPLTRPEMCKEVIASTYKLKEK